MYGDATSLGNGTNTELMHIFAKGRRKLIGVRGVFNKSGPVPRIGGRATFQRDKEISKASQGTQEVMRVFKIISQSFVEGRGTRKTGGKSPSQHISHTWGARGNRRLLGDWKGGNSTKWKTAILKH